MEQIFGGLAGLGELPFHGAGHAGHVGLEEIEEGGDPPIRSAMYRIMRGGSTSLKRCAQRPRGGIHQPETLVTAPDRGDPPTRNGVNSVDGGDPPGGVSPHTSTRWLAQRSPAKGAGSPPYAPPMRKTRLPSWLPTSC